MKTQRVMNYEGFRVVISVDVAAFLGRRHDLFVRRIERLIQEKDLRSATAPNGERIDYFFLVDSSDENGIPSKEYRITLEGCEQIAACLAKTKAQRFTECFQMAFSAPSEEKPAGAPPRPAREAGPVFSLSDIEPLETKTFTQTEYWMNEQGTILPKLKESRYVRNGEEVHTYMLQDGRHIAYAMEGILIDRYQMLAAAVRKDKGVAQEILDFAQMLYYQKGDRDFDTLFDYVKEHVLR